MDIHFGLSLDGQRARRHGNRLGNVVVGPMGLLDILEGMLGLQVQPASSATRIAQYRDCLKRANVIPRFYSESFAVDPLGVAATLLSWRDLWHLHGWCNRFGDAASQRLRDIDDVEALAASAVAPSIGERLRTAAVNAELTLLYWQIGRRIHAEVLKGQRAEYGKQVVVEVARQLTTEYGKGWSERQLRYCLRVAEVIPDEKILHTPYADLTRS